MAIKLTKSAAAQLLGEQVFFYARANYTEVNRDLVEARFSELHYSKAEESKAIVAARPHWKTVLRAARGFELKAQV